MDVAGPSFAMTDDLLLSLFDYKAENELKKRKEHKQSTTSKICEAGKVCSQTRDPPEMIKLKEQNKEMVKKLRSTQSELFSTRERNKNLASRINSLEKELMKQENTPITNEVESNSLQDRLRQSIHQLTLCRDKNLFLTKELKQAVRALEQETGDSITNIGAWVAKTSSGWKGRQQLILLLKTKVKRLENELKKFVPTMVGTCLDSPTGATQMGLELLEGDSPQSDLMSCSSSSRLTSSTSKTPCRKLESENKELIEEVRQMKESVKAKNARIAVLTMELQESREKLQLLGQKGQHDNLLIKTLMQRNESLHVSTEMAQSGTKAKEKRLQTQIEKLTGDKVREEQLAKSFKVSPT